MSRRRLHPAVSLSVGAVAAGATGVGYAWLEARHFALRRFTLPVLPAGSSALRVLHVSDLHLVPRQRRKFAWLQSLGDLEPDLVVSTGDTVGAMDAVEPALAAHGALLDRPGVFVMGSNDYYEPRLKSPARYLLRHGGSRRIHGPPLPTDDLVKGFVAAGWTDLNNRRTTLEVGGHRLELVGVDDPHIKRDRYDLIAGPADRSAGLTIGVAHAPYRRTLDAMTADGAGLVLAGHTHGGQLCLPGFGALVTNCDLPRSQAKGASRWPTTQAADPDGASGGTSDGVAPPAWLHVSAGLGTSPFTTVRFACRPEASLLTLVARQD